MYWNKVLSLLSLSWAPVSLMVVGSVLSFWWQLLREASYHLPRIERSYLSFCSLQERRNPVCHVCCQLEWPLVFGRNSRKICSRGECDSLPGWDQCFLQCSVLSNNPFDFIATDQAPDRTNNSDFCLNSHRVPRVPYLPVSYKMSL